MVKHNRDLHNLTHPSRPVSTMPRLANSRGKLCKPSLKLLILLLTNSVRKEETIKVVVAIATETMKTMVVGAVNKMMVHAFTVGRRVIFEILVPYLQHMRSTDVFVIADLTTLWLALSELMSTTIIKPQGAGIHMVTIMPYPTDSDNSTSHTDVMAVTQQMARTKASSFLLQKHLVIVAKRRFWIRMNNTRCTRKFNSWLRLSCLPSAYRRSGTSGC